MKHVIINDTIRFAFACNTASTDVTDAGIVQNFAFDDLTVTLAHLDGVEAVRLLPRSDLARRFLSLQSERKYFLLDTLARFCLDKTPTPLIWEETLTLHDGRPLVRRAFSAARMFSWPAAAAVDRAVEGLSCRVAFAGPPQRFTDGDELELRMLGLVLNASLARFCQGITTHATTLRLTNRERETLRWGAMGKTSEDIADILGLTKRTVDQHFENAGRKLGTLNRVQTVVKAFRHNLISP